jgi:hypothetical protein
MVPQGYAAPNTSLNSTFTRGNALSKKLGLLGIMVTSLDINPIGAVDMGVPSSGITVSQAQAAGVGPDDLVHLLFQYVGSEGNQAEVAVIEQLIASATVSSIIELFDVLFPNLSAVQCESRALTALANLPGVASALKSALA